jgi:hypothetical protein
VPYILATYGDFLASITPEEVERVLYTQHGGWFTTAPEVSGLIYFREKDLRFEFTYFTNPAAINQPAIWSSRIMRWSDV